MRAAIGSQGIFDLEASLLRSCVLALGAWAAVAGFADSSDPSTANVPAANKPLTPQQHQRLKERDELDSQASALLAKGKFDDAVAASKKALAVDREVLGDEHRESFDAMQLVVRLMALNGDFAAQANWAKKAWQSRRKVGRIVIGGSPPHFGCRVTQNDWRRWTSSNVSA